MQCPFTARRLVRTVAVATLAALLTASCAQHVYQPGTYSAVTDTPRYTEDWFAAARAGRTDIVQALIDAHFPLETTTPEGYTALILSAYDNHPETLKALLSADANACAADRHGNTALMGALFKGETNIATMLLDTHCDIDQTNNAGETALSFAALFGRLDMIPVLVAHGANANHVDARGGTALQMAIAQHNPAAEDALRHAGATQ
ncbi:ankyrin repeat domain-containing protein [Paraburkholderia madseniana]|uniref:ankyrin repeat domain-containing protein n=1 Tax=Paraburkholderia madseniana TaxID=2599607 RepID=UPI0015587C46|nr:ankyrin repeat domain-containing protein [Paraburkholderia madseniana]NPT64345.1 ankyrin repeat domain-containing protein [Paraburkholderia madseniana]